ncbi:MAG: DNA double-strand break repair nuclease NurA [Anaerolineae bacterium]|nr:DNA double-strand break repair nuclease NurA [Anaerolineae bacterium]
MSIDVRWLKPQIERVTEMTVAARAQRVQSLAGLTRFFAAEFDAQAWQARLEAALAADAKLSVAQFSPDEVANAHYGFGNEPAHYALLCSDGSQILPDRHKPALFGLIHVACVSFVYGVTPTPALDAALAFCDQREVRLLGEDALYDADGELKPTGEISTERDLLEIEVLAARAQAFHKAGLRVIALADGAIMPFSLLSERMPEKVALEQAKRIGTALDQLRECGAIIAGYIDRPNSNALLKAIALGMGTPLKMAGRGSAEWAGVFDRQLIEMVLPPSRRTALFNPNWQSIGAQRLDYAGHGMRCCYANMAMDATAEIVRIEMPTWCADEIATVLAVAQRHSRMGNGYPFCLKAAHENAVITKDDQGEVEYALLHALTQRGLISLTSAKQSAKDLR